jgi:hypothetical protein
MSRVGFLKHEEDAVLHFLEVDSPMKRETPKINGSFAGMSVLPFIQQRDL